MQEREKRIRKSDASLLALGKVPPSAIELEELVLGAMMLYNESINKIIHIIKPEIFYKEAHQNICTAILNLFNKNSPFDICIVTEELRHMAKLDVAGGPFYIAQLTTKVVSSSNIKFHCMIILQKYLQREIIRITSEVSNLAFEDTTDVFELYEKIQDDLKKLGIDKAAIKETIENSVDAAFDMIDSHANPDAKNYFKTRSENINKILAPTPGNILLIGGMSKHGKTSFMADMVMGLFENNPNDVSALWYSMEDPPKHIILGYISREIKLSIKQMLGIDYKMSVDEITLAKSYKKEILGYDIEYVGNRTKIKTVKNHFINFVQNRKEKYKNGKPRLYILVIDNLMKLSDYGEEREAKTTTAIDDYVASIIGDIFDTTKDCCYIIYLHHFTKEQFDKRNIVDAFRPSMGHFRGSSRIHEICTQVALINRPGFFSDLVNEYKGTPYYDVIKKLFIVEVMMNRFIGSTGIMRFLCDLDHRTFEDLNININN